MARQVGQTRFDGTVDDRTNAAFFEVVTSELAILHHTKERRELTFDERERYRRLRWSLDLITHAVEVKRD